MSSRFEWYVQVEGSFYMQVLTPKYFFRPNLHIWPPRRRMFGGFWCWWILADMVGVENKGESEDPIGNYHRPWWMFHGQVSQVSRDLCHHGSNVSHPGNSCHEMGLKDVCDGSQGPLPGEPGAKQQSTEELEKFRFGVPPDCSEDGGQRGSRSVPVREPRMVVQVNGIDSHVTIAVARGGVVGLSGTRVAIGDRSLVA